MVPQPGRGPLPLLRHEGGDAPIDIHDLELGVRRGQIPGDALVQYEPWTGGELRRIAEVPELRLYLDDPDARFARHLRGRTFPALALGLTALVLVSAVLQTIAQVVGVPPNAFLEPGAIGWDSTFLDGHWWSVWSAHFLHWDLAPLVHAIGNAGILSYCGYRVEQAWGRTGFLRVVAGAMAVSALFILFFESRPVIGSSTIAFGLLGAQIGIGFRQGEAVPVGWRGFYGWGTLFAVTLLVAFNIGLDWLLTGESALATGVSHVAHAGGFVGGGLGVLGRSAVLAPEAGVRAARTRDLFIAALTLMAPLPVVVALPLAPAAVGFPWETVTNEDAGITLSLPVHMAERPVRLKDFDGFLTAYQSGEPFLADRYRFASFERARAHSWTEWWSDTLGVEARPVEPPIVDGLIVDGLIVDGWTALAWMVPATGLGVERRIVELQRTSGLDVVRVAWIVQHDGPDFGARERLYREVFRRLVVGDSASVREARTELADVPGAPKKMYGLAYQLYLAGQTAEADQLIVDLLKRDDAWPWEAARLRLQMYEDLPPFGSDHDPEWLERFVSEAPPTDLLIWKGAVRWLTARHSCGVAGAALDGARAKWAAIDREAFLKRYGEDDVERMDKAFGDAEAMVAACAP